MHIAIKLITDNSQRESLQALADRCRSAREWLHETADPRLTTPIGLQQLHYQEIRDRFGLKAGYAQTVCREVSIARNTARKTGGEVSFERDYFVLDRGSFSVFVSRKKLSLSIAGLSEREHYALNWSVLHRSALSKVGRVATKARVFLAPNGTWTITVSLSDLPDGKSSNRYNPIRKATAEQVAERMGV